MAIATSIELDETLTARVRTLAETRRRSDDSIMREAIAQYVEREERRDALKQDMALAWEDYRRTGLHLTQAEADEWLARLEAGDDAEPPSCHR